MNDDSTASLEEPQERIKSAFNNTTDTVETP